MKNMLIINGSPRKNGNTNTLLNVFHDAVRAQYPQANVECIDATKINLKPCVHCDGCKKNGGNCVMTDDTVAIMNKAAQADVLIFGTPVYWWGITAQLKIFIDKLYSKGVVFEKSSPKKIGLIVVGQAETDDRQYALIKGQFECICEFLNWNCAFYQSVSASEAGEVSKQAETLLLTAELAKKL